MKKYKVILKCGKVWSSLFNSPIQDFRIIHFTLGSNEESLSKNSTEFNAKEFATSNFLLQFFISKLSCVSISAHEKNIHEVVDLSIESENPQKV